MKGIIIGAGIGGLTTGVALQQRGISFTLYEAAPEIRAIGAGIWMATNAMQVLKRLGLAEKVLNAGVNLERAIATEQDGTPLQIFNFKKVEARYGIGTSAIHRAHLQQILYETLPPGTVVLNKRLASVRQDGQQVVVTFEDGAEERADFLIGADGIKSVTRSAIFGKLDFRYSGQTCWRGIAELELPAGQARDAYEMWGKKKGLRFGFSPVNERQVYFFTTLFTAAGGQDEPGNVKAKLMNLYSVFGPTAQKIMEATPEEKIIRSDIHDFKPIPDWSKGRVALVGDAAHATTPNLGQGGCQAVEDAYVIAHCLAESESVEQAFEHYQKIRYPKAAYVVNTSWRFSQLTNVANPFLQYLRNTLLRSMPERWTMRELEKVYSLNY